MTETPLKVMIVDDQELIRTGFALILDTAPGEPGFRVVAEAADGAEAVRAVATLDSEGQRPDVILMDVRMAGMNGIEATRAIVERFPGVRIIVLTTFDLDEYALAAIEAGASGFLLKDARAAELIGSIRAVADGDAVMAPSVTQRLILRLRNQPGDAGAVESTGAPRGASETATTSDGSAGSDREHHSAEALAELTEREQEVFGLIAEGLSNAEIGARLFLSESTVKTHVGRVLTKLGLRDRVHAVIYAFEAGIR